MASPQFGKSNSSLRVQMEEGLQFHFNPLSVLSSRFAMQRTLLTKTLQAGRHVGREIKCKESDAQSYPRCQRQEGLRDNHGAGGTYGLEIAK
jgi:hypothetical protein